MQKSKVHVRESLPSHIRANNLIPEGFIENILHKTLVNFAARIYAWLSTYNSFHVLMERDVLRKPAFLAHGIYNTFHFPSCADPAMFLKGWGRGPIELFTMAYARCGKIISPNFQSGIGTRGPPHPWIRACPWFHPYGVNSQRRTLGMEKWLRIRGSEGSYQMDLDKIVQRTLVITTGFIP